MKWCVCTFSVAAYVCLHAAQGFRKIKAFHIRFPLESTQTCFPCLILGIIFTWPSCTIKIFESSNTTLNRPMTETELALLGSLSSIGAMVSTPLVGVLLDVLGRKNCIISSSMTFIVSWAIIAACNQVELILFAVFISGVGGAILLIAPVFIAEICQETIRGSMTAGSMIFYSMGMLISYVLGGCLDYYTMVYVNLTMSVLGTGLIGFLRESPTYLMKKNSDEGAAATIAFYRSLKVTSKEVQEEMATLKRSFNPDLENEAEVNPDEEKLKPPVKTTEKLSLWKFVKKSKATRQAAFVNIVTIISSIFQGLAVVQVYAGPLFEEAVPSMSPTLCSVLLAVVTVIAGLAGAYLIDYLGRRPLMVYSSVISSICCVGIGTQLHLHWGPHWLTAVFLYLFSIAFTVGPGSVPFVLVAEVFLPEVKSFFSSAVIEIGWLCNFIILFIFTPLVSALGLGPVFYVFAAVCAFTVCFTFIYLPETNKVPVDEIPMLFVKRPGQK